MAFQVAALLAVAACTEPSRPTAPRFPGADLGAGPSARYTITDIGSLGGAFTQAIRINQQGQLVGKIDVPSGRTRAFFWRAGGGMRDLGTLAREAALAQGVNNQGEVAGFSTVASGGPDNAVIWTAQGQITDLGTFNGTN